MSLSRPLRAAGALSSALALGCAAQLPMKPPTGTPPPRVLAVREIRAARSASVTTIAIGAAEARKIAGTPIFAPGSTPYGRAPDPDTRKYGFELAERTLTLRAECQEQARDAPYFGLGKRAVDLYCTCHEGESVRAALLLSEGRGEAALPEHTRYAVWETHEDVQGRRARAILGYRFRNARGEGAVDVSQEPRAYLPATLGEPQRLPLLCLYVALLLHRPIK